MPRLLLALCLTCWSALALAQETVRVAVATNFQPTLVAIVESFEQTHPDIRVRISAAASGVLYNQITHGAPFDLFLSADIDKVERLEQAERLLASADYATGQLVFWVPGAAGPVNQVDWQSWQGRYAMANPKLAPYGRAASELIAAMPPRENSPVTAQNVAQSYQYVATGAVAGGFIALSQVHQVPREQYWQVDPSHYQPIVQRMALLSGNDASRVFWDYLQSAPVRALIVSHGYLDD